MRLNLTHWMEVDKKADGAFVLSCPEIGCGRRVVISATAEITIVDTGDFYSRHVASVGPVVPSAGVST